MAYEFDPSAHGAHMQVLSLVPSDMNVLDVGCADGYLAARLSAMNCRVVGIELDEERARRAREFCEGVVVGAVESVPLPFSPGQFDVILYADILEHTPDPLAVLRRLDPYLQKDGKIVISLPNIAHFSVRLPLLMGDFTYTDSGILDRTHLRFFTYRTAVELIREAGYAVEEVRYTGVAARSRLLRLWPALFSHQFVFLCSRL